MIPAPVLDRPSVPRSTVVASRRWTPVVTSLTLLAVVSVLAWHGRVTSIDRTITGDLVQRPGSFGFRLGDAISIIGSGPVVGALSLVIGAVIWHRRRDLLLAAVVPAAAVCGGAAELLGKHIVERLRPTTASFTGESGFGFPSGHTTGFTTMVVAVALVLAVFAPSRRIILHVVALVVAALIAVSRVLVGAHYAFDVVAGLALGVAVAHVVARIVATFGQRSLGLRLAAWPAKSSS